MGSISTVAKPMTDPAPIKYRFKSRAHVMEEMARLSSALELEALKTVDAELRSFYNGKANMCAELVNILCLSHIDGMEN
jgi:hypothetical protein